MIWWDEIKWLEIKWRLAILITMIMIVIQFIYVHEEIKAKLITIVYTKIEREEFGDDEFG